MHLNMIMLRTYLLITLSIIRTMRKFQNNAKKNGTETLLTCSTNQSDSRQGRSDDTSSLLLSSLFYGASPSSPPRFPADLGYLAELKQNKK